MTIRKTMVAIAAPFALAAVIGGTAVFAQSGETPAPSTEVPPVTAPEEKTPGKTHDGSDCPRDGSGSDTASLY